MICFPVLRFWSVVFTIWIRNYFFRSCAEPMTIALWNSRRSHGLASQAKGWWRKGKLSLLRQGNHSSGARDGGSLKRLSKPHQCLEHSTWTVFWGFQMIMTNFIDLCLSFESSDSQMAPYVVIWCHCTSLYRFLSYGPWSYGYGVKWSVWPQVQANLKMKLPTLGSRKSRCVLIQWHFFSVFFSIAKRSCAVQSLRPWFWRRNSDGEKLWKAKLGCTGRPSKSSKSPAVT